jgi:hypothetical protein
MNEPGYFYNLTTHQVEQGRQSPGGELMGPYATREEAEAALATAQQRNESWEREDQAWDDEDD